MKTLGHFADDGARWHQEPLCMVCKLYDGWNGATYTHPRFKTNIVSQNSAVVGVMYSFLGTNLFEIQVQSSFQVLNFPTDLRKYYDGKVRLSRKLWPRRRRKNPPSKRQWSKRGPLGCLDHHLTMRLGSTQWWPVATGRKVFWGSKYQVSGTTHCFSFRGGITFLRLMCGMMENSTS